MDYFSATDFEPATGYRNNICQGGMVRVESAIITHEINFLFQPPNNYYWNRFTDIHGIAAKDTLHSPAFAPVWQQIVPYIENQNVIEHNDFGVYFSVLDKTLLHYSLLIAEYNKFYTYKIYMSNLATLR
tara:strand:- start:22556 stop:22942 length:387 start_codon:yes stop_codon:yes gene_type:complete